MKFYNDCRIFIYTDDNRAPRCNVTSDVGHRGTPLPRVLGLRAAMFTPSNTGCYQAERTWQPRMLTDWVARERAADDNLGALLRALFIMDIQTSAHLPLKQPTLRNLTLF